MPLPEVDSDFLRDKAYEFSVQDADGFTNVIIEQFTLPECYQPQSVRLLIRLPAGYPTSPPDMFFTQPHVTLAANGGIPLNCGSQINAVGQTWQQWSRHFPPEEWRPWKDSLRTYVARIKMELAQCR